MPDWLGDALYIGLLIVLETALAGFVWFKVAAWVEAGEAARRRPIEVEPDGGDDDDGESEKIREEIRALTRELQALRKQIARDVRKAKGAGNVRDAG